MNDRVGDTLARRDSQQAYIASDENYQAWSEVELSILWRVVAMLTCYGNDVRFASASARLVHRL